MILSRSRVVAFAALIISVASLQQMAQSQPTAALTDAEVLRIVVVANQIDIDYGKLALSKSKNKDVRDLAQQMINDHSELQKAVFELSAKLLVKPADSENSKSLKSQAEETTKKLNALESKAFDKAYVENEIAFHMEVLNANALMLIPNAHSADLKAALNDAQLHFQGHVQHAQKVKESLESDKNAASHKHG